ncbi:MAG: (d)CMP kinase [Clostridia bacterium]|nr:(d)CMP kinase [Clostridia bacterium]
MNLTQKPIAIAIDGPSGAGKSTLAKMLAKEFGLIYVDTGALYRAVGYAALQSGIDPSDTDAVIAMLPAVRVELAYVDGEQKVLLNGEDIGGYIRTPEVSAAASTVSAIPAVRDFLFALQQDIAKTQSVVMDGRDIGTVVLPWADVKIFLTASAEKRAQRRYKELIEKGQDVTYESVLADMVERDARDSQRETAPLKAAEDAVLVDTSELTLEESKDALAALVKERLAWA